MATTTSSSKSMVRGSFLPHSKLHAYLAIKTPTRVTLTNAMYTLYQIFEAVLVIINRDGLFDASNPSIIVCDRDMEVAFDAHAMHVNQVKTFISKQMNFFGLLPILLPSSEIEDTILYSYLPWTKRFFSKKGAFGNITIPRKSFCAVRPAFLDVLQSVEGDKKVFRYCDILVAMIKYLRQNRSHFFDSRNMDICSIEGSLLERAFNVSRFSKYQFEKLVMDQIVAVNDKSAIEIVHRDHDYQGKKCFVCNVAKRQVTFIHDGGASQTCYLASCNACARIIYKRKLHCPGCNNKIDQIVFQSQIKIKKIKVPF